MFYKPEKHYINFYEESESSKVKPKRVLLLISIITLFLAFLWFFVIDNYLTINKLRSVLSEKNTQLNIKKEMNMNLDVTEEEYRRFGSDYLTEEEKSIIEREEVIRIIDDYLLSKTNIVKLQIVNNETLVTLSDTSMGLSSEIINNLYSNENKTIDYVGTKSANNGKGYKAPTVEMLIRFKKETIK